MRYIRCTECSTLERSDLIKYAFGHAVCLSCSKVLAEKAFEKPSERKQDQPYIQV